MMEDTPLLPGSAHSPGLASERKSSRAVMLATVACAVAGVLATVAVVGDWHSSPAAGGMQLPAKGASLRMNSHIATSTPNLVVFYIDDQGYNDMGPQSTDLSTFTPSMEKMAEEGVWLTHYYGMCVCTPSRAALLTGMYPIHSGMQHGFLSGNDMWGLDLSLTILPQMLADAADYNSHMVGKWHLGHFKEAYAPYKRGFSSWFGHYSGFEGYFSHTAEISQCSAEFDCYHDLFQEEVPVWAEGTYNLFLFNDVVQELFANYGEQAAEGKTTPFFLYYAPGVVHEPLMAPESALVKYADKLVDIPNAHRRMFAAMTLLLDEAAGNMTDALKRHALWDNTLVIVASDNGANVFPGAGGSNYPLRGTKGYLWEGSTRVHAMVSGGIVPTHARGTKFSGLFHVTDWVPTLLEGVLGRGDVLEGQIVDGHNQWSALVNQTASPRTDMVYNIDRKNNITYGAVRMGDMKLLVNVQQQSIWPVPTGNNLSVYEGQYAETEFTNFLFNVSADPSESHDLRHVMPEVFNELYRMFSRFESTMAQPSYCGYANNTLADEVYSKTQFVGPFVADDVEFTCPETSQEESSQHQTDVDCLYALLPTEACVTAPSAAKIAALKQHNASDQPSVGLAGNAPPPSEDQAANQQGTPPRLSQR